MWSYSQLAGQGYLGAFRHYIHRLRSADAILGPNSTCSEEVLPWRCEEGRERDPKACKACECVRPRCTKTLVFFVFPAEQNAFLAARSSDQRPFLRRSKRAKRLGTSFPFRL